MSTLSRSFAAFLLPLVALAHDRPPLGESADREILELQQSLSGILTSLGGRNGHWGVLAISIDRGDTVLALNPSDRMTPASNQKLLTTAAALALLGPDFRLETYLLGDGEIVEGALEGNLIFFGTGDPTLSERFYPSMYAPLDSLAGQIRGRGIREIRGDIVVDGSFFLGAELHPDWDPADLNNIYAAPVSAVSFNESYLTVQVRPAVQSGVPPLILTRPEETGLPVANLARTTETGTPSRLFLLRDNPFDPIGIQGAIPMGGREVWRRLPVPDPLLFAGVQLRRSLEARGIQVSGDVRAVRDPVESRLSHSAPFGVQASPRTLAVISSPPLRSILRVVNKESHNLYAESVFRILGRVVAGDGSFEGGARVVQEFLVGKVGVPPEEVFVRDGSGLSPVNGVSPGGLVRVLAYLHDSLLWSELWETLPEAGVRGELGRMGRTPASRNLRAKTGTLEHVSALSGMVRTRSGERVLFSILANGVASEYRAKRAEDQIGIRLASLTRPIPD